MQLKRVFLTGVVIVFVTGCAAAPRSQISSTASKDSKEATPIQTIPVEAAMAQWEAKLLSELQEFNATVNQLFAAASDENPDHLRSPQTLEDAKKIVRSSHVAFFSEAEKIFESHMQKKADDLSLLTWYTQLYLSWGQALFDIEVYMRAALGDSRLFLQLTTEQLVKSPGSVSDKFLSQYSAALAQLERDGQAKIDSLGTQCDLYLDKALPLIERIEEISPDTYHRNRLLADYYSLVGEAQQFANQLKMIESKNPESNGLRYMRGLKAAEEERWAAAIGWYEQALHYEPEFTEAEYARGFALWQLGQKEAALDSMYRILVVTPDHTLALLTKWMITTDEQEGGGVQ